MASKIKSVDFDFHKKSDVWFLADAIFLVLNRKPKPEFNKYEYVKSIKPDSDKVLFDKIYHQAKHSMSSQKLKCDSLQLHPLVRRVNPSHFLAWAQEKGFEIPGELLSMIEGRQAKDIERKNKRKQYNPTSELGQLVLDITIKYYNKYSSKISMKKLIKQLKEKGVDYDEQEKKFACIDPNDLDKTIPASHKMVEKMWTRSRQHTEFIEQQNN